MPYWTDRSAGSTGRGLLSRYKKVYITNAKAGADEVARFYRERLGGIQADCGPGHINTRTNPQKIKPGAAGSVEYALCTSGGGYREHIRRRIIRANADEVRCLTVIVKDMLPGLGTK